jgi:hypothetical protein
VFSIRWQSILFPAVFVLGLLTLISFAEAAVHMNGHTRIKGKGNGKHRLITGNGVTAHAHVFGGKVTGVTASHTRATRDRGATRPGKTPHVKKALTVRKFKSRRRLHAALDLPGSDPFAQASSGDVVNVLAADIEPAAATNARQALGGTLFVGFGFIDPNTGQLIIFWFPVNMVQGGDSGCTDVGDSGDPGTGDFGDNGVNDGTGS